MKLDTVTDTDTRKSRRATQKSDSKGIEIITALCGSSRDTFVMNSKMSNN